MEIKISTKTVLKILAIFSWIIFIGLCIEAGGIIFNAFYTLAINSEGAKNFWMKANLSNLYQFDKVYFSTLTFLMIVVSVFKAILFYLIVKMLHNKQLNLSQPFNLHVKKFIQNTAYLTIGIGIFSFKASNDVHWYMSKDITMPDIQSLKVGGADVWIFMGIVLFVIAQIFKRGIEIQLENELTV